MEILSPAGSLAALKAAVENGADAVYMGTPQFNARVNAQNFTDEEFRDGVALCKKNGVRVYAVLNTLVYDGELREVLELAGKLTEIGADAFIVQDIGLAAALRRCTGGSVPLHASTQMSVANLDGVLKLSEAGFARAVLARELSRKDYEYIASRSPIELEVFVHGALCVSFSGQCRMSAVIGGRSGNRGCCAQPCRLPYVNGYALSLKDNCLLEYVPELEKMGISSLKIEGRMKGAAYVGAVTAAYADAKRGKPYSQEKEKELAEIFSRDGFTDGYYTGNIGREMFGVRKENPLAPQYIPPKNEYKRFIINFTVKSDENYNITFTAEDKANGFASETSVQTEKAGNLPTGRELLEDNLSRLGGTPYGFGGLVCDTKNAFIPVSAVNKARRELVASLDAMRSVSKRTLNLRLPEAEKHPAAEKTLYEAQFVSLKNAVYDERLSRAWFPLTFVSDKKCEALCEEYGDKVGFVLPMIIRDEKRYEFSKLIEKAANAGISSFLCGNLDHIYALEGSGAQLFGDTGLNVTNAASKDVYLGMGLENVTLSFEMNMRGTEELADSTAGFIAYGRLPFMTMRNCIKGNGCGCENRNKPYYLKDRMNKEFLVTCAFDCGNEIWNSDRLWLADKELPRAAFGRLIFTDETPGEIKEVIGAYVCGENAERDMNGFTRGLYYR